MSAYHRCSAAVIERLEGHVAKYLGDRVLAYFGWPRAPEDDAERAVRAGLALIETIAQLEHHAAVRLQARTGETQALFRALYGLNSHHGSRADVRSASEAAATLLSLAYDQHDVAVQTVGHRCAGVTAIWSGEFQAARRS